MHQTTTRILSSPRLLPALAAATFWVTAGCAGARMPAAPSAAELPAGGIPVLAWHGFADQPTPGDGSLTESYARFEETLVFLKEHGFRSVFPEQVRPRDAARGGQVILTFDDGTRGQLRAAEIMERHGFRGIFFVIPNRTRAGSERFITPDEVERLVRAGHRVAAHGYDHRSLPGSGTEVAASLVRSPRLLRAPADADFAFPFGHYTPEVAEALAERYHWLHTVNPGYWDGRSALLPRMLVMSDVDPALFRAYVLDGARYAPVLRPLSPDGAVAGRVAFLAGGGAVPEGVELFSVSADASGRGYVSHPLGESLRVSGDTVWVDLAAHMARHYTPERSALSYALVTRRGGELRYLTPGLLHWIRDPVAGPPRPQPPAQSRP